MIFKSTIFIGVDPSASGDCLTYAALDSELNPIAVAKGDLAEVAAFAGGYKTSYVGVNAPRRLNKGLMKKDAVRDELSPRPNPGRYTTFRVAEYQLFQKNIRIEYNPQLA